MQNHCDYCHDYLTDSSMMEAAKVVLPHEVEHWCGSCIEREDYISTREGGSWDEETETWLDEFGQFARRYEDLPTDNKGETNDNVR